MADMALVANANRIEESVFQMTLPANEDLAAMDVVRLDPTNGRFEKADGSDANAAPYGIVTRAVKAGMPVTAVRIGVVDGLDLSGLDFGAILYASDTAGRVGDVAGTNSYPIGRVIPATASSTGSTYDKLLMVQVNN
jgi:hypothetical protein